MSKYEVQTKFVFSGTFTVEAESREQAKELVHSQCGLVMGGKIHSTLSDENCDWSFPVHPETVTGKVRKQ